LKGAFRFREGQFSPSEAAAITGLSLTLQRDWRSQGHLRPRTGGRASFSPQELAEMRVMVKLRGLGLPLPESRRIATEAAPSVVFVALANHSDKTLAVEAPAGGAEDYIEALEKETNDGYLCMLANLAARDGLYRYAILEGGGCKLLVTIDDDVVGEDTEAAGLIKLWACARFIAESSPRPLFTLIAPMRPAAPR
jgi:hypothetical protein